MYFGDFFYLKAIEMHFNYHVHNVSNLLTYNSDKFMNTTIESLIDC